jgi:hypothetical protein
MARAVARGHRRAALARVQRKGASPGLDGMPVAGVPGDGRAPWPQSREARWAGPDHPPPGQRVEMPQPGGGGRPRGGPTGRDRVIPHAGLQGRQPAWATPWSARSDGRRPGRAIARPGSSCDGLGWPRRQRGSQRERPPPNRRRRDPSGRWGGRGEVARPPPIPIRSVSCNLLRYRLHCIHDNRIQTQGS